MRKLAVWLLCLFSLSLNANMASPYRDGSLSGSPFIARNVDILHEKLYITPSSDLKTAKYVVEYHIRAGSSGMQVPLAFYAADLKSDFRVWLDGKEIEADLLPSDFANEGRFDSFSDVYGNYIDISGNQVYEDGSPTFATAYDEDEYIDITAKDLRYFETDITEGKHTIRVEYTAGAWVDESRWVRESEFRYVLSPAKYWRSFGNLEVFLTLPETEGEITSNLGRYKAGSKHSRYWVFSELPVDVLKISHRPEVPALAEVLIAISPFGMMIGFGVLLSLLHFFSIRRYIRAYPNRSDKALVILGGLMLPFLMLYSYLFSYDLIDVIIGEAASRRHGYTFFILFLYFVLMPCYLLAILRISALLKRKG